MPQLSFTYIFLSTWNFLSRTLTIAVNSKPIKAQAVLVEHQEPVGRIVCLTKNIQEPKITKELNMASSTLPMIQGG
jgi:hypothetical protein